MDEVVNDVAFPAIHDAEEAELVMSGVHCSEVKTLVFALGAND